MLLSDTVIECKHRIALVVLVAYRNVSFHISAKKKLAMRTSTVFAAAAQRALVTFFLGYVCLVPVFMRHSLIFLFATAIFKCIF